MLVDVQRTDLRFERGPGDAELGRRAVRAGAIAITSGLIVQLPLVLGVMPVFFGITERRSGAPSSPATTKPPVTPIAGQSR